MKTIQFKKTGEPAEVLECIEVPVPEPQKDEVRVKLIASPINPSDLLFIKDQYGSRPQPPSAAGFEGVGIIDAAGEGVNLAAGARVHFRGLGCWSEYTIVNQKSIIPVPEEIADEAAAQLYVNPFTALGMLDEAALPQGGWLLLTAAGSAICRLIIQVCKLRGIKTIGTVRRDNLNGSLKQSGLTEVINTEKEDLVTRVKKITGGQGVQCVMDAVGGPIASAAIKCMAQKGLMLVYGLMGTDETSFINKTIIFNPLIIKGFWLTEWRQRVSPEKFQQVLSDILELLKSKELQLPVDETYTLADIAEAVKSAGKSGRTGKVLLKPA